jgi:hypothetical protein
MAEESMIDSRQWKKNLFSPLSPLPDLRPTQPPIQKVPGALPEGKGVTLEADPMEVIRNKFWEELPAYSPLIHKGRLKTKNIKGKYTEIKVTLNASFLQNTESSAKIDLNTFI